MKIYLNNAASREAKSEILPGESSVNQVRASPFSVAGKNLHHAASLPVCTLICALKASRWSMGLVVPP